MLSLFLNVEQSDRDTLSNQEKSLWGFFCNPEMRTMNTLQSRKIFLCRFVVKYLGDSESQEDVERIGMTYSGCG